MILPLIHVSKCHFLSLYILYNHSFLGLTYIDSLSCLFSCPAKPVITADPRPNRVFGSDIKLSCSHDWNTTSQFAVNYTAALWWYAKDSLGATTNITYSGVASSAIFTGRLSNMWGFNSSSLTLQSLSASDNLEMVCYLVFQPGNIVVMSTPTDMIVVEQRKANPSLYLQILSYVYACMHVFSWLCVAM